MSAEVLRQFVERREQLGHRSLPCGDDRILVDGGTLGELAVDAIDLHRAVVAVDRGDHRSPQRVEPTRPQVRAFRQVVGGRELSVGVGGDGRVAHLEVLHPPVGDDGESFGRPGHERGQGRQSLVGVAAHQQPGVLVDRRGDQRIDRTEAQRRLQLAPEGAQLDAGRTVELLAVLSRGSGDRVPVGQPPPEVHLGFGQLELVGGSDRQVLDQVVGSTVGGHAVGGGQRYPFAGGVDEVFLFPRAAG